MTKEPTMFVELSQTEFRSLIRGFEGVIKKFETGVVRFAPDVPVKERIAFLERQHNRCDELKAIFMVNWPNDF